MPVVDIQTWTSVPLEDMTAVSLNAVRTLTELTRVATPVRLGTASHSTDLVMVCADCVCHLTEI